MNDSLVQLLMARRKRLVATILGHAERELYPHLSFDQQKQFRSKTLGAIDEFCDLIRDVLKVSADDADVNAHVIDLLEKIHDKVT